MKELVNFHGSDIEKVAKYFELDESRIKNFGGNVNPMGLSDTLAEQLKDNIHLVTSYPDPDYASLKDSIANYTLSDPNHVLLGNGTTELIAHYIDYVNPKKAMVVGPTYSEYEKKMATLKTSVTYFPLMAEKNFTLNPKDLIDQCDDSIDLLVLCNPNNPTATLTGKDDLIPVFEHCKSKNIYILIDETYMDFVDDMASLSGIPLTNTYNNCMVLRGFSKFFSAPGLRLGYGITSDFNCHRFIEKQRHHWAINSLAAFAGARLLKDRAFIEKSKNYISSERERILTELEKMDGIKVYPTKANFFFLELLQDGHTSNQIFTFLIKRYLMIRDASSFPFLHGQFIRFCILDQDSNNELLQGIEDFLFQNK